MKKIALGASAGLVSFLTASIALASGITVAPFTFSALGLADFTPNGGPAALGRWERVGGDWQLHLAKNAELFEVASAGAQVNGVAGLSTTGLTLGFVVEDDGYCGAGAPRFNVRTESGLYFLGCIYGNNGLGNVSFSTGVSYGGITIPADETIESISIVHDEPGTVHLDDIKVNAMVVGGPNENRK